MRLRLISRPDSDIADALKALPQLQPSAETMSALHALAETATPKRRWYLPAALAATVLLTSIAVVTLSATDDKPVPEIATLTQPATDADTLESLAAESAYLDRLLAALPAEGRVQRVGTASTITALEDRVATIDQRLNTSGVYEQASARETLLRERVGLMTSLVSLRAGAQPTAAVWL
ncbi:MAG: hypothetical protein AAAFM81_13045 [Pseudomonadota bacterium]